MKQLGVPHHPHQTKETKKNRTRPPGPLSYLPVIDEQIERGAYRPKEGPILRAGFEQLVKKLRVRIKSVNMLDPFHTLLREMALREACEQILRVFDNLTQIVLIVCEVHLVKTDNRIRDGFKLALELLHDRQLVFGEEPVAVEERDFHDDFYNVLHHLLGLFFVGEVEFGDAVAVVYDVRGGTVDYLFGEPLRRHLRGELALDAEPQGLGWNLIFFTHFLVFKRDESFTSIMKYIMHDK